MIVPQSFDKLRRIRGYVNAQNPRRQVERVEQDGVSLYLVPSETEPGVIYKVFPDFNGEIQCVPCKDFAKQGKPCKHIFEVIDRFASDSAPPVDEKLLQKFEAKAGGKDWYVDARRFPHEAHKYGEGLAESTRMDHAYEEEDERVESLLVNLAHVLDMRHPQTGRGRRPLSPGQKVLAMVLRRHHNKSIRVFRSRLKVLVREGLLAFAPRRTTWVSYNTSEETTELLREAFEIVTSVFRHLEREVIVDATGISPFYVSNWRDFNYGSGTFRVGTTWYKMHVAIGRASKAIIAFLVTPALGQGTADSVNIIPLIRYLRGQDFSAMKTAIADNAYLVPENFAGLRSMGVELVGPLRPRNFDKSRKARAGVAHLAEAQEKEFDRYDDFNRGRQVIEAVFGGLKRHDNHLAGIGTRVERDNHLHLVRASESAKEEAEFKKLESEAAVAGLYRSRINEFFLRAIVQVLRRTVQMEHLYNRRISYTKGRFFSHVREFSDEDSGT